MVVAVSGASLVGDPGGAFTQSFRQTQQFRAQQQQQQAGQERQQELQRLAAIAFGTGPQQAGAAQLLAGQPQQVSPQQAQLAGQAPALSRDDALSQLFSLSPDLGSQILEGIGAVSEVQREDASRRAFEIRSAPPDQREAIIRRQATQLISQGRNPKDTLSLLEQSPEEQDISLKTVELAALSAKERLAAQPRPAQLTTSQRDIIAEGKPLGSPEFQQALREKRVKPSQQIIFPPKEKALGVELIELAKSRVRSLDAIRARAAKSEDELSQLDILENIDVRTGALEPAKLALASFIEGFGVDASGIANVVSGQAFTAESGKAVLRVLERQKGPQTDDDRRQIAKTIARLGNVSQANTFIAASARAFARRTVDQRDFFETFLSENKTLEGATRAWNLFKRNTPMVSKKVRSLDGLPMFFFKFRDIVKRDNPEASEDDVLQAWRDQERAAK